VSTVLHYESTEWDEVAEVGMDVFLVHEDAPGGAVHGRITAFRTDDLRLVAVARMGDDGRLHRPVWLRVGLIGEWLAYEA
jgi:hypothetical protein